MYKKEALEKIEALLKMHFQADEERAQYLSERIWREIISEAIETERRDWIHLAKFPGNHH